MGAEGAAAINEHFWRLMGKLWQDNPHERHTASDKLRNYTVEHKIHVNDVSQTVDRKNKPDWQLRSEAGRLRRMVETLEAEIEQLKRAHDGQARVQIEQLKRERDAEVQARQMAQRAAEALNILHEEELRRAEADAVEARTALIQEREAHRLAADEVREAGQRQARLKAQLEQSEALAFNLKRQLQTLNAHTQTLRADLAGANELQEALEHALEVAIATATNGQRELLLLKMEHQRAAQQSRPRFTLFDRRRQEPIYY
jgi:chromosome segregation ATPase